MGVTAWSGKDADEDIIRIALESTPSIIVDCANKADPHRFISHSCAEAMQETFVISLDLLYSLRDIIYALPKYAQEKNTTTICFTSFARLFHYQDDEENVQIFTHCWQLIRKLGKAYTVHVVVSNKQQRAFAKIYANEVRKMGHTATSQRQVIDQLTTQLKRFSDVLSPQERIQLQELLNYPLQHIAPITHASSLHTWAFFLLAICLEQQKHIEELYARLDS